MKINNFELILHASCVMRHASCVMRLSSEVDE